MATQIVIKGLATTERRIQKIIEAFDDMSPAFDDMAGIIIQEFAANFKAEGSLTESWMPLAPSTLKAREKGWGHYALPNNGNPLILTWTGDLAAGFQSETTPKKLTITNAVEYAKYAHIQRPIVGSTDSIMQIIAQRIELFIRSTF